MVLPALYGPLQIMSMGLFADPDALGGLGGFLLVTQRAMKCSPLLGCRRAEPTGIASQCWELPLPWLRAW